MWEAKKENRDAIARLWKAVEGGERGELLTHEDASELLGVGPPSDRYYQLVESVRRKLLKQRGISLVSVPLVGYALATPSGQVEYAGSRYKKIKSQSRKIIETLEHLPEDECDAIVQKARHGAMERARETERQARKDSQLVAFLMRPRDAQPRIHKDGDEDSRTA